jgi:hypothetical protein
LGQARVVGENVGLRLSGCEPFQDQLDGDAGAANDGFTGQDVGVSGN